MVRTKLRAGSDRADQIDADDIRYQRYIPSSWRGALTKRMLQVANLLRAARGNTHPEVTIPPLGYCFGPEDQQRWAGSLKTMAYKRLTGKKSHQR